MCERPWEITCSLSSKHEPDQGVPESQITETACKELWVADAHLGELGQDDVIDLGVLVFVTGQARQVLLLLLLCVPIDVTVPLFSILIICPSILCSHQRCPFSTGNDWRLPVTRRMLETNCGVRMQATRVCVRRRGGGE